MIIAKAFSFKSLQMLKLFFIHFFIRACFVFQYLVYWFIRILGNEETTKIIPSQIILENYIKGWSISN